MTTTRVLCLGNELVRDDGAGIRVGRILRDLDLGDQVSVELRRSLAWELLDELAPDQEMIIVDASRPEGKPGKCRSMDIIEVEAKAVPPYCSHGVGIAEILQVARHVTPDRIPKRLVIVGIEAEDLEYYGTSLSDTVRQALPEAVEIVLRAAGCSDEVVRQGKQLAHERKGWDPDRIDTIG